MDLSEVFTAEVRGIQALFPEAHQALLNWGRWCRDRVGIFPSGIVPPAIYESINRQEWDKDGYGEEQDEPQRLPTTETAKAERPDLDPYNEKEAIALDEFLHTRFTWPYRRCLVVAYVLHDAHDYQYPSLSKCTHSEFLERLAGVLGGVNE